MTVRQPDTPLNARPALTVESASTEARVRPAANPLALPSELMEEADAFLDEYRADFSELARL